MQIFTMGFTKKSAQHFFEMITKYKIDILIDIRLNNQSQLASFTKGRDLEYFLEKLCACKYEHDISCAPTQEILQQYKKGDITWEEYEAQYNALIVERNLLENFVFKYSDYANVLLLCSEPEPRYCHRRLLSEQLEQKFGYNVIHI